jgi:CMP-2-keto-3-deoxyoctulosonic acid synthetase
VCATAPGAGVDTPEDLARVRALVQADMGQGGAQGA